MTDMECLGRAHLVFGCVTYRICAGHSVQKLGWNFPKQRNLPDLKPKLVDVLQLRCDVRVGS